MSLYPEAITQRVRDVQGREGGARPACGSHRAIGDGGAQAVYCPATFGALLVAKLLERFVEISAL
jgi:hypothetical protein